MIRVAFDLNFRLPQANLAPSGDGRQRSASAQSAGDPSRAGSRAPAGAVPSEHTELRLRRQTVMRFFCPVCNAAPEQPCVVVETGEVRGAMHIDRVDKAQRMLYERLQQFGRIRPPRNPA